MRMRIFHSAGAFLGISLLVFGFPKAQAADCSLKALLQILIDGNNSPNLHGTRADLEAVRREAIDADKREIGAISELHKARESERAMSEKTFGIFQRAAKKANAEALAEVRNQIPNLEAELTRCKTNCEIIRSKVSELEAKERQLAKAQMLALSSQLREELGGSYEALTNAPQGFRIQLPFRDPLSGTETSTPLTLRFVPDDRILLGERTAKVYAIEVETIDQGQAAEACSALTKIRSEMTGFPDRRRLSPADIKDQWTKNKYFDGERIDATWQDSSAQPKKKVLRLFFHQGRNSEADVLNFISSLVIDANLRPMTP